MRRTILFLAAFGLAAILNPNFTTESSPMTKAQLFGIQLEACQNAWAGDDKPGKCELYGKIEVVDNFPDVKIEKVDNFPDIKVKWVDNFPDEAGKWKKVDNFADYKVKFVDNFADYKVKFVDNFPGCD